MIDQLIQRIDELNNPTVVGLDPRQNLIPDHVLDAAKEEYGETLEAIAKAYFAFNKTIIDWTYDLIPAVKPQVAMYEALGHVGLKAYMDTIDYAKEKGLIVIGDIKRSDIASTAAAYSMGHIGKVDVFGEPTSVYKEDFITLNPFLGVDSIEPYLEDVKNYDKGLFLLVKTSNPNSGQLQDLKVDGRYLYEIVGDLVHEWGNEHIGEYGYSKVGAVVGATHKEQGAALRKQLGNTFFLVPGYGAQGATASDLAACFDKDGRGAIVNSSRGIIGAYTLDRYKDMGDTHYGEAARQAVLHMRKDLNKGIGKEV